MKRAIEWERKLELGMEGHRLFDLNRWGTTVDVMTAYLNVEKTRRPSLFGSATFTKKSQIQPIPEYALVQSLDPKTGQRTLEQNDDY